MKIKGIKNYVETHRYAPEMSKLYLSRLSKPIPVPGCTTVREARRLLGWLPARAGIHTDIRVTYPAPFDCLNHKYSGYVQSRAEGLRKFRELKKYGRWSEEPIELLDGSTLPGATVSIKFRVVG